MSYKPHILDGIESIAFASEESRKKAREIAKQIMRDESEQDESESTDKKNLKLAKPVVDKQAKSLAKPRRIRA
jgi:hypothetical protein